MKLIEELKRRGVLRVGSAYVIGAWLVAQVAEFFIETFGAPLWMLRSIVIVLSVALLPVLVFTWMFEFTPAGFRRQDELDRAGVVVSRAGRRFDYLLAVLLLAAAGWLALSWSERTRTADEAAVTAAIAQQQAERETRAKAAEPTAPANSIAVLPFLNLSTAPDSGVLADGLAEELLGVLGRNRALRVTARSSAFQFKDQNRDLREVGKLLGVRYILEGSVRLAASRARIGTQLIDTGTGTQLWSGTYDRTLEDLFALQDEIAGEVARALNTLLVEGEAPASRGTLNAEAHLALMRGLQLAASRRVVDLDRAIAELQRAIALDPGYAAAYVELAYAISTRALQLDDEASARPVMAPLLDKALALDPENGPAKVLRGSLLEDPLEQEKAIREGLALAPSHARGYEMLAGRLGQDPARTNEALVLIDQAIALDPLSPRNHQMKGLLSDTEDGFAVAEKHFLRAIELEPNFRMALVHLASANMARGNFAAAVHYGERAVAIDPGPGMRSEFVRQLLNIGDVEAARRANKPAELDLTLLILLYEDDIEGAMNLIRATPAAALPLGGASPAIMAAVRDARANGNWEANLERVRKLLAYTGELPAQGIGFGFNHAQLAYLLRGAGALADAERLDAQLMAYLESSERAGPGWTRGPINWTRAMLHAPAGRTEAALDALEIAFSPARPYWYCLLDDNPMFDGLRKEPRYQALRNRLEQHLVAQRALLAEMRRKHAAEQARSSEHPASS